MTEGAETANIVPGSSYSTEWTLRNVGTEDVYYKITGVTLTLTIGSHTMTADELTAAKITVEYKIDDEVIASIGGTNSNQEYSKERKLLSGGSKKITISVTIGTDMPNRIGTGDGKVVFNKGAEGGAAVAFNLSYSATISAVQVANNTNAQG